MQVYTDKEVLADGLAAQKCSTNLFNMAMNECVHENVRETFSRILDEEHIIQVEVKQCIREGFTKHQLQKRKKCKKQHRNFQRVVSNKKGSEFGTF